MRLDKFQEQTSLFQLCAWLINLSCTASFRACVFRVVHIRTHTRAVWLLVLESAGILDLDHSGSFCLSGIGRAAFANQPRQQLTHVTTLASKAVTQQELSVMSCYVQREFLDGKGTSRSQEAS